MSPPCESYLRADQLDQGETFYPLHVRVCERCLLVQLPAYIAAEDIFSRLRLLLLLLRLLGRATPRASSRRWSSGSASARASFVVEVASNDGYLLQHVVRARHPRRWASSPRRTSPRRPRARASPTEVAFLGEETGAEIADQARHGRPGGGATTCSPTSPTSSTSPGACVRWSPTTAWSRIEIPHLLRLIEGRQYDTIYHEHYSYFTLLTATRGAGRGRPRPWSTSRSWRRHGGSLRTWSMPAERAGEPQPTRGARAGRRGGGRAAHRGGARRASRSAVARVAQRPRRVPGRALRARAVGRRLRRARQGQHAAQPLRRSARTCCAFTVDRNPYKHGQVPARARTSRSIAPERLARGAARLRPDPAVEPARRDRRSSSRTSASGAAGSSCRSRVSRSSEAGGDMKVVIFCGGLGMRMRDGRRVRAQADDADRRPAGAVARHALLRPLRPHRVHPVPGLRRRRGQGLLPATTRDAARTTSC